MIRAQSIHKVLFRQKTLAPFAVIAAVLTKINIAFIIDLLQDLLDNFLMAFLGRTDKIIVGYLKTGPHTAKKPADGIGVLLRGLPSLFRCFGDFIPVLIRPRKKVCILPHGTMKTGHTVGHYGRVGMSQMRLGVYVINRCSNIERLHSFLRQIIY